MQDDYYALLRITPQAEEFVIKAAHKALAAHYNALDDNERLKEINIARDLLLDPDRRAQYDHARLHPSGTILGGRWRLVSKIAEGGFGTTYKGEHVETGKPVCMKHCSKVSPDHRRLMLEEAEAAWDLRHYGIPAVRDLVTLSDGSVVLVTSFIEGPTIEQAVQKIGRFTAGQVAWITDRSLNILLFLYDHGMVHGDVKPQNIMVQSSTHQIVLVDYGLALARPTGGARSKGFTPIFASPEEMAGKTILPESDLYSLGMTMLYMLTGDYDRVKRQEVPREIPEPMKAFLRQLIVPEVRDRPRWENENLWETFKQVRIASFGSATSGMEPIPGL